MDSNYKFVVVDIGACGMEGNSNFSPSAFGMQLIIDGQIPFPEPKFLPDSAVRAPHVIVGVAFPSLINLVLFTNSPPPQQIKESVQLPPVKSQNVCRVCLWHAIF